MRRESLQLVHLKDFLTLGKDFFHLHLLPLQHCPSLCRFFDEFGATWQILLSIVSVSSSKMQVKKEFRPRLWNLFAAAGSLKGFHCETIILIRLLGN